VTWKRGDRHLRAVRASPPPLTDRFLAAVALACETHGDQRRLGTEIPYLAHLLVVTGLVFEDGGDEAEAIAAMLHDAVEDGGGHPMLERIRRDFGDRVADIVEACSDNLDDAAGQPWLARKQRYLEHLSTVTDEAVLRVALADKVHNARSIARDYRAEGHRLWERFHPRTPEAQLWYYERLLELFEQHTEGPLVEDFRHAVDELTELTAADALVTPA
jgi:(p)ppGpp synthase/HD superfamily hydrolase